MRPSKTTNTLVLISKKVGNIYNDRRVGNELFYTGMGLVGNQKLERQNKTLYYSNNTDIEVHLFEINEPTIYKYMGRLELIGKPFLEEQNDKENNKRKVWIFPLKLIDYPEETLITEEEFRRSQEECEKEVKELRKEDIEKKARQSSGNAKTRKVTSNVYERDLYVAELVKINAKGICQLCENRAPFRKRNGDPYLEVHHIEWLSDGGKDIIENTTALCPNCHKKMHIRNLEKDKMILKNKLF